MHKEKGLVVDDLLFVCLFVGWFVACVSSRDVVIVIMVNTRGQEYHRCFIRKVITASAAAAVICTSRAHVIKPYIRSYGGGIGDSDDDDDDISVCHMCIVL